MVSICSSLCALTVATAVVGFAIYAVDTCALLVSISSNPTVSLSHLCSHRSSAVST